MTQWQQKRKRKCENAFFKYIFSLNTKIWIQERQLYEVEEETLNLKLTFISWFFCIKWEKEILGIGWIRQGKK